MDAPELQPDEAMVIFDPKAPGMHGTGKTSFAALMAAELVRTSRVTSTDEAIALVETALRAIAPWPEPVTVHDPLGYRPRLAQSPQDRRGFDPEYNLTVAEASKARAIRLAVRSALGPTLVVRLPNLLLVVGDRAVTSIWEETVRQAVTE